MGTRPRKAINNALRRTRGRPSSRSRRVCRAPKRSIVNGGASGSPRSSVSDKLEALKSLIPAHNGEAIKADQLFQETADYIILLRTQVLILQKLIDFYGSNDQNQKAV